MKKQSEMTIEQIEEVLENVDWTEVHKLRVFSDYGDSVVIFTDGSLYVQGQGTYYRDPDAAGVLGYLRCWGQGNIDRTYYYEGWATPVEDGYLVDAEGVYGELEGQVISEERMIEICIEDGQHDDDEVREALMDQIEEQRDYQAMLRGEA